MKTLIGAFRNRASISYAPTRAGGVGPLFTGDSSTASRNEQLEAMGSVGTLFAIVNRLSDSVSQTEWALFEKDENNPFEVEPWSKRVLRNAHPAARLWENPNPFQTQQEFVASIQQHYELTGEGWAFVSRNPRYRMPLELWPMAPDRVEVVPHPTKFIAGYVYTSPSGEKMPLEVSDVIRLRNPNPVDPYRGMGPVQTIMADLEGAQLTAEWNRNFFRNSAQPGGIIKVDRRIDDVEFDKLLSQWNSQHKGSANAHRVAILTDAEWVERKYTQTDMQFTELRRASVDVITGAYGFPKSKLGIVEDVNRANSDAQDVGYARDLIRPRLARWRSTLNSQFLRLFGKSGEGLEFEYPDPVVEDSESQMRILKMKAEAAAAFREQGWKADDILETVALPHMEFVGIPVKVGGAAVFIGPDGQPSEIGPEEFPENAE